MSDINLMAIAQSDLDKADGFLREVNAFVIGDYSSKTRAYDNLEALQKALADVYIKAVDAVNNTAEEYGL